MPTTLHVHLLPSLTSPEKLAGSTVVVIDVLRASTTIVCALAAGASQVIPCLEVEQAKQLARQIEGPVVLGGERGGLRIDGFDLGNSPREYTPQAVGGKTVVFTTTNGTRAMMQCKRAERVLVGSFVNFSAICRELAGPASVHLLCASTQQDISSEDVLLAGAIVDDLARSKPDDLHPNDQATLAMDSWRMVARELTSVPLVERLRGSRGGRNLLQIGMEQDIELAARIDTLDVVPQLDTRQWRIRLVCEK